MRQPLRSSACGKSSAETACRAPCASLWPGSNSSGKSPLSQFGLEKFFGSPKEQAEARPVLERKILGKERKRSSREVELDELKQQYVKRLKAVEDLEAEKAIVPSAVELGKLGGRPHVEEYSTAGLKSNRRRAGMAFKEKGVLSCRESQDCRGLGAYAKGIFQQQRALQERQVQIWPRHQDLEAPHVQKRKSLKVKGQS